MNNIKRDIIICFNKILNLLIEPKIKTIDESIDNLIESKCSVARFGDGELGLINSRAIKFQENDTVLSNRLMEIIKSKDESIMICIPGALLNTETYTDKAKYFWDEHLKMGRMAWYKRIRLNRVYYDTQLTRLYMDYKEKENSKLWFKKIRNVWEEREIVIIEGEKSRLGVGNDLFGNSKLIERVLCPATNAFSMYSDILNYVINNIDNDKLILIALGPTATVLAYDLHNYKYQAIDIGHIDIEYEWFLKGCKEKVPIGNKFVNEVSDGQIVTDEYDRGYLTQIIKRI